VIEFPCKCGFALSVPADQAGGVVQCPNCGLLADVPTLDELKNLHPDGTIAFENPADLPDDMTAADLHRLFTRHTTDDRGIEKNLRPTAEHFRAIGLGDEIVPRNKPRYDPVTGELIRPLQLKGEAPAPVISMGVLVDPSQIGTDADQPPLAVIPLPVPAAPVPVAKPIAYATGSTGRSISTLGIAIELLMPANAAVMVFVYALLLLGHYQSLEFATFLAEYFPVWPLLLLNLPLWLILAHAGCTIDDIGPEGIDELPRPLRNFSFGEDILTPLFRTLLAMILCYWPALLSRLLLDPANPMTVPIIAIMTLAGTFFFPAVLLTALTGTTILNLAPARLTAVIRLCGGGYFLSIALLIPPAVLLLYYLTASVLFPPLLSAPLFITLNSPRTLLPALLLAVYLLHYFCWQLGLMYRAHHDQFPWLAQRHVKEPKPQAMAQ
jgi:hypothetical protein